MSEEAFNSFPPPAGRPKIAFFGYPDVFEDFYPQYGVGQRAFATTWACSGNHAFVKALQERVGEVTWYEHSLKPELEEARHEAIGCRVRLFRSSLLHRWLWSLFYLPKPAWRWRRFYRAYATVAAYLSPLSLRFLKALRADRPDLIFVQDYCSGRFDVLVFLARWLGVPVFAYHAGSTPERYLSRSVRRLTLPRADQILASNRAEADKLACIFGVPLDRLPVILTPIDTAVFRPLDRAEACLRLQLDPARRYLLYVGRLLDPVKRVSSILRAFSRVMDRFPNAYLLVAGTGPDEAVLKKTAAELAPNRVHFLGWVDGDEDKALLFNVAECLLLPSLREGFPTVVGEALACGTPVLGTRLEGIVELVEDGSNGWLIDPGDDEALHDALIRILNDQDGARSMRKAACSTAEARVSPATVARQFEECLRATASARRTWKSGPVCK